MPNFTLRDGTPLYYEIAGWEHARPPIVFLNGMSQSTAHWRSHVRHFESERRVMVYNARGQGGGATGDVELTLKQHCDDLHDLLQALEVERVQLVGFSHGARVALGYASYYPSYVDKLVLVSASATMSALARTIVKSWLEVLTLAGLEGMVWASLPMILGNEYLAKHQKMIPGVIKASVQRNSKEGIEKLLVAMQNFPPLEDLAPSVIAPTLVISADHDPLVDPEGARALADKLNGRHELIKGCGHTIPIEVPSVFQQLIYDFL